MTIEEIQSLWAEDAKIDSIRLDDEALAIPQKHSKYFNILNGEKRILIESEQILKTLKRNKMRYYLGKMSQDELRKLNWTPFGDHILKSEKDIYIDTDPEVADLTKKVEIQRVKVEFLTSIITNINNRNFSIKSAIDYRRFVSGT